MVSDATFRDVFKAGLIYQSNWAVIVVICVEPIHPGDFNWYKCFNIGKEAIYCLTCRTYVI
jgi:hypothetical protein